MEKHLNETAIPNEYVIKLKEENMVWMPEDTHVIATTLFHAMAEYLSVKKSKDVSVGVKMTTLKGDFLLGATVSYIVNEDDEDMPGNWDLSMTLDEAEYAPEVELLCNDDAFINILCVVCERLSGMKFNAKNYIGTLYIHFAKLLKSYLDINANADEPLTIVMPKACTVTVAVEGDKKITSIVPDEILKQIVKDDSRLEVF